LAQRNDEREIAVTVGPDEAGSRLDRLLAARIGGLSRARLKALILAGRVRDAGGTLGDPATRVKPGQYIVVQVPAPEPAEPAGEDIALAVVHEDAHLIVVDKPAGLVVHPAAGHREGTLVNALIAHCGASLSGVGGVRRPGIVHRLDKDTSGLMVIAKTDAAHAGLAAQFASHGADGRLERAYLAVVWGEPRPARGTIDAPLGRSRSNRTRISVSTSAGARRAVTRYEVVERFPGASRRRPATRAGDGEAVASLVRARLETGRTHQIRVHFAHIGHPLLGDRTYGAGFAASAHRLAPSAQAMLAAIGRQALHAAVLGFEHPSTGRQLRFESPLPAEIKRLVEQLREQD
jgi:23S rRNA pseudouridine1911/1915/1917 synthase